VLRKVILAFDAFLSRQEKIFVFDDDPGAILRGQFSTASGDWIVAGHRIPAGSPILQIHLFNEHIPPIPERGVNLAWAVRIQRPLIASFRKLAHLLKTDPAYAAIRAISGVTVIVRDDAGLIHRLFARLGFSILPYENRLARFGEFWENFYSWWVMWAYNQPSLRGRHMLRMRRNRIVMTREDLLRRFG
jgi:hypothetical protein